MTRKALATLAALTTLVAIPATASHRPNGNPYDEARYELDALDAELDSLRNQHLRWTMEQRVERLESLIAQMERRDGPPVRPGPPGMSFDDAMYMVRNEAFDSGKLEVIRRVSSRMSLTSDQARALADEMTFEGGKADALIALYPSVRDKGRFYRALDILTFASTRRRVERALSL